MLQIINIFIFITSKFHNTFPNDLQNLLKTFYNDRQNL